MGKGFKKVSSFFIIYLLIFFLVPNKIWSQDALQAEMKKAIVKVEKGSKDAAIREAAKKASAFYTTKSSTDTKFHKLLNVSQLLITTPKIDSTIALPFLTALVKSMKALPASEDNAEYATSLHNLAFLYWSLGQYKKSEPLYLHALSIRKKVLGEAHPAYATTLHRLAYLYWNMGQYAKSLPLHQQALELRKKIGGEESAEYATSLNDLAVLYWSMGQYDKSECLYQQALTVRKNVLGENHPDYATSLHNCALLYWNMGQYEKALPMHQQALAIRKKTLGEEHPDYASSLNDLALLYWSMGQYQTALLYYQQAVLLRKRLLGNEHPAYAGSLHNMGMVYWSMGQYEKALALHQQARAIRLKVIGKNHPDYATSLRYLAMVYWSMGQYDKALPLHHEALSIVKNVLGEGHPAYAFELHYLAFLYVDMGQYEKALPLFQKAAAIRKALGEAHPDYATSLNAAGMVYSMMGDYRQASSIFMEASQITLKHLGKTYSTLSENEKINLLKIKSLQFDFLPTLLYKKGVDLPSITQQLYTNELALKGMVLEDQHTVLNSIRKSGDVNALELYDLWHYNKTYLGKQLLLPVNERSANLDSLENIITDIEQKLSRNSATFKMIQQRQTITTSDISNKLKKDEAAIEFISFRQFDKSWTDTIKYAALILLPQDNRPHFVPLFEEAVLKRILATATKGQNNYFSINKLYPGTNANIEVGNVADTLYSLIWAPLEPYLSGIKTIYYAPSGLLHNISFAALKADPTHLLIDNYQLNPVLSTRSVAFPAAMVSKPKTASVWGDITYSLQNKNGNVAFTRGMEKEDQKEISNFDLYTSDTRSLRGEVEWDPLPGTKVEIDSLRKIMLQAGVINITLSGLHATEDAFKALDKSSPQILHLATHGFFLPVADLDHKQGLQGMSNPFSLQQNPMFRSGLVLAGGNHTWEGLPLKGKEDGILTAYEIAQMDLSNTDIVVLSACVTALGDLQGSEGAIGLQRALKMAGVKQMIVSLWPVPDKATAELMTLFYKNWLGGMPTRAALRKAQLDMKAKYPFPFFWAAFKLVE